MRWAFFTDLPVLPRPEADVRCRPQTFLKWRAEYRYHSQAAAAAPSGMLAKPAEP
jgi:hypothetical protein